MVSNRNLEGKSVAILVDKGFEQVEMTGPRQALDEAGARTVLISPESGTVRAWAHDDWGEEFPVDVPLDEANAEDYDAIFIPGGVMSPDHLRMNDRAVRFVRSFSDTDKPIASICHGPWMLVEADVVRGRTVTSWPSLRTDLRNAGAVWVDREVVRDGGGLVTSRRPDDIPAFSRAIVELFGGGAGEMRRAA
jgi:protease I